ncbi:MAG: hypothetical protein O2856_19460 [Planctomycetota bacterium]|nr:hypothetical protein [Planctomycetota bacterium]
MNNSAGMTRISGQPVDMSGEAVLRRLQMVGELNELCWFLGSSDLAKKAAAQAGRVWQEPWLTIPPKYQGKPSPPD